MNLPNFLTLSRVFFLLLIAVLLYLAEQLPDTHGFTAAAFILLAVSALTDWGDGFVARKLSIVSDFGKLMDALVDKIFITGTFIILLTFNMLPAWGLFGVLLILSREFLITGLRMVAVRKGLVLPAEKSGKLKTFFQFVALFFLLAVVVLQKDGTAFLEKDFQMVIFYLKVTGESAFLLAVGLTLFSGIYYLYHYRARQSSKA